MSQEQDKIFFRNFSLVLALIAIMMVAFYVIAKFASEKEEHAEAIETYENNNTPICLPKNKPNSIPNGTGESRLENDSPTKLTPALAKAKRGIIINAT